MSADAARSDAAGLAVDGVAAKSVVRPASADEVARVLREADGDGLAVIPVGGGRAMGMGDPPERFDVALETAALDRIVELSQADLTVTVEAGVTLERLGEALARVGQFLPLDPFASPGHTIGGVLACAWSGPLRLRYGSARDFLIGLRVALPDGSLASSGGRVVKNVSGYDMNKLHHGALGSLGVIVAASFKVFPKPLHEVTLSARPAGLDQAWDEARRALAAGMPPVALQLSADGQLLARLAGTAGAVRRAAADLGWEEADPGLWRALAERRSNSWARISVPPGELLSILRGLPPGASWQASPGVGVVHWFEAGDAEALRAARSAAEACSGSLVLLAAPPGLKRELGAWGSPPAELRVMRRLRDAFDPRRTLSPGRYPV